SDDQGDARRQRCQYRSAESMWREGTGMGLRRVCAGLVMVATAALAAAGTSTADDAAPQAVVNGHARFEVLSPTLIRMEYAGDDKFADPATFNAIGRDDFGHTAF